MQIKNARTALDMNANAALKDLYVNGSCPPQEFALRLKVIKFHFFIGSFAS